MQSAGPDAGARQGALEDHPALSPDSGPDFAVVHIGKKVRPRRSLGFPLIVKSLTQEGSTGISQASVVHDETKLRERVQFIHESIGTDAILERYIEGRELYVGIIGNSRLSVFRLGAALHQAWRRGPPDRHRTGQVERQVSAQATGSRRARPSCRTTCRAHPISCKRVSLARPERLRAHRSPDGRRRQGARDRGEPEPAARIRRGLRGVRRARRRLLRAAAAAHHPDGTAVAGRRSAASHYARDQGWAIAKLPTASSIESKQSEDIEELGNRHGRGGCAR